MHLLWKIWPHDSWKSPCSKHMEHWVSISFKCSSTKIFVWLNDGNLECILSCRIWRNVPTLNWCIKSKTSAFDTCWGNQSIINKRIKILILCKNIPAHRTCKINISFYTWILPSSKTHSVHCFFTRRTSRCLSFNLSQAYCTLFFFHWGIVSRGFVSLPRYTH